MKACFLPTEGFTLVEFDYKQLEFRMSAAYSHVYDLVDVFNNPDRDIFLEIAGSPEARDEIKQRVFSLQYGAGAPRISRVAGISMAAAKNWIDSYYLKYPGFKHASDIAQMKAENSGKIQLWSGRYRHFKYPHREAHKAFNSLMQGGGADMVEATMRRCKKRELIKEGESHLLLQVHDSLIFEIRDDLLSTYVPAIKDCMADVESDTIEWGVKFPVDAHIFGTKVSL